MKWMGIEFWKYNKEKDIVEKGFCQKSNAWIPLFLPSQEQ